MALTQMVYFIQAGKDGPIKIGIAENPEARRRQMQTGSHETLTLLAVQDGGAEREAFLHARHADDRIRGEWFASTAAVLASIPWSLGEEGELVRGKLMASLACDRDEATDFRLRSLMAEKCGRPRIPSPRPRSTTQEQAS